MQTPKSPLALLALAAALAAQSPQSPRTDGDAARPPADPRVMLEYAQFDPLVAPPQVPEGLQATADVHLFVVQFQATPDDRDRAAVTAAGGRVVGYLPHDCHLVRHEGSPAALAALPTVRWVGPYQPAYRLDPPLLAELLRTPDLAARRYDMVMVDKHRDKARLEARVVAIGGRVVERHPQSLLFSVALTGAQLLQAARFDEVLWINAWGEPGVDMNNARAQGGANYLESVAGYTGTGVRGHVYEGVEFDHPDFATHLTNVLSGGEPDIHGHCTAGIIFGDGTSTPSARGLVPDAIGFYTNHYSVTAGFSRNQVIDQIVNGNNCMFTTASWGGALTGSYNATSADADDIVFDHRIPWTNSMSNWGTNVDVRPEAWAKNVISVGAVWHGDNSAVADDSWAWPGPGAAPFPNASIGPAADTRNKPDLCAYYEDILTSDLTAGTDNGLYYSGSGGYTTNDWTPDFGGTSGATPIVAGFNGLAIQMFTDQLFSNPARVPGGSRFQNRPFAQTLKALMIAGARDYTPTATTNRREHVGWGFPNVGDLYSRRDRIAIVPEDVPIVQGATHEYRFEVLPGETDLKVVMTYLDPAGNPAAAFDRVNDLNLRVESPAGLLYWGNYGLEGSSQTNHSTNGGVSDSRDTVECAFFNNPIAGVWTVRISAPTLTTDANVATGATDATYALVVNGGRRVYGSGCARYVPDTSTSGGGANYFPWGGYAPVGLTTTFTNSTSLVSGGAIYFDVDVANALWVHSLDINTTAAVGTEIYLDLYTTGTGGTYVGNQTNPAAWLARSAGRGTAAGVGVATHVELAQPFRLPAGTYGFAVSSSNFGHAYTSQATTTVSDANVSITGGVSTAGLFSGSTFSPRYPNVTLNYRTDGSIGSNVRYQTIVRHDELGNAGDITGLAFAVGVDGRHFNSNLQVRMSHVPSGHTLSTTFANNLPAPVLVLSANNYSWYYAADQWREIGLQAPFHYDGSSDVVIEVLARGNVQTSSAAFYRSSTEPRVVNASWSLLTPATAAVDDDSALRMRVSFDCAYGSEHGASCGRLDASHIGDGHLGSTFWFRCSNATPNNFAFLGLGLDDTFPFPLSLTQFGWTNCNAYTYSLQINSAATSGSGLALSALSVPNDPTITGARVFGQWFQLDSSEPGDITFSGSTRVILGRPE
ncbi:MAG: S8 family serine peptidase [Planctomycetes bacterium]|nr:S8 family serine peptidase [Planctomycetota bacterium]